MRKVIIGAGGFARELKAYLNMPHMLMYVDDEYWDGSDDCIRKLSDFNPETHEAIIAIGDPMDRHDMVYKLPADTKYWTYIHHTAQIYSPLENIGKGSIICPGVIITTNVKIGNHAHLNLLTTIGHDCEIGNYFTTAPGAKISGNCKIYSGVYVGTNASIKQKLSIHSLATIGMNAAVVKHIEESGTYVGVPAKKL
jgi:sugar O-acyltransferase (sialic acid O-acetyltransferase NeuD family)